MESKREKSLRKGYTTGTCAAAAAKAAAIAFFTKIKVRDVEISLPVGEKIILPIYKCEIKKDRAIASVIKDAGDDPDVTNGAEIVAVFGVRSSELRQTPSPLAGEGRGEGCLGKKAFQFVVHSSQFTVFGGKGIGIVTKPGLAIPVGEPAINPVPRKMIEEAIKEAINPPLPPPLEKGGLGGGMVIISVPNGEEIAKKTMNARLGIIGGISILGTTGLVEPLSLSAYRHSITCAIDVAIASKCKEIIFSTGRSSEKVAEKEAGLPEDAFILVGDHMGFALKEARCKIQDTRCRRITIVGQFGKFSKLAAGHFETHCTDSSVELDFLAGLAKEAGATKDTIEHIKNANTARQVFFILREHGLKKAFKMICEMVIANSFKFVDANMELGCMLIGYDNEVVEKA